MEDDSDASIELGYVSNEAEDDSVEGTSVREQNRSVDKGDSSSELKNVSFGGTPQEQTEDVNQSSRKEFAEGLPEMDEKDVAEMSMIVAQIEGAEDFNLTLETVDTTEDREQSREETRPKSRQSKKEISPLYKSDQESIEKFLEEGMNESMSVVEEAKINVSLADSLLNEWGTPVTNRKRSLSEHRRREDNSESSLFTSTPAGRLKPLQQFFPDSAKSTTSSKKRVSTSSAEDQHSPIRKRRASISENDGKRSRSKSFSKSGVKSPSRSIEKPHVASKHPLKTRNM